MLGCNILCLICEKSQNKITIRDAGGVEAIVFAMMAHISSEIIQDFGCRTLSCVSLDPCAKPVTPSVDSKILQAILSAMNHFPESSKVQKNAVLALRNITMRHENMDMLISQSSRLEKCLTVAALRFPEECYDRANVIIEKMMEMK